MEGDDSEDAMDVDHDEEEGSEEGKIVERLR
jgi:hypothetical protein